MKPHTTFQLHVRLFRSFKNLVSVLGCKNCSLMVPTQTYTFFFFFKIWKHLFPHEQSGISHEELKAVVKISRVHMIQCKTTLARNRGTVRVIPNSNLGVPMEDLTT